MRTFDRDTGRARQRAARTRLRGRTVSQWLGTDAGHGHRAARRREPRGRAGGLRDQAAQGTGPGAGAGRREEHHRGGVRQGWGGQVHHGGQPGAGTGPRGRAGRRAGRRYLRAEPGHHVRYSRGDQAGDSRPEMVPAAGGAWRATDVHGVSLRRQDADGLARPDGVRCAAATDHPDRLEGSRLPGGGHAARNRRYPADPGAEGAGDRLGDRHHAAGPGAAGRQEGRRDVPQGEHSGAGRGGEHGRAHLLQLRPCRAPVWRRRRRATGG